jgi:hypothetical protein
MNMLRPAAILQESDGLFAFSFALIALIFKKAGAIVVVSGSSFPFIDIARVHFGDLAGFLSFIA